MQINKFKYDGTTTTIEYTFERDGSLDEIKVVLKSTDEPKKELKDLLASLKDSVEEICCLAEGYCSHAEIRGVSFSWTSEIMGAVITALVPVETANSPVVINTPHLPEEPYSDGNAAPVLPTKCRSILKNILKMAEGYVNGDRKPDPQTVLEFPEGSQPGGQG